MERNFGMEGFGGDFKGKIRNSAWRVSLSGYGEIVAEWEHTCEIDGEVVDA
jgi:hypothetical protein